MCSRIFTFLLSILFGISLSSFAFAVEDSAEDFIEEPEVVIQEVPVFRDFDASVFPQPPYDVHVIPEEAPAVFVPSVPALYAVGDSLTDTPPSNPVFYGSGYVSGTDSSRGNITLYCPIDYKSGVWGTDRNGYLFNVSSRSLSGYLAGVYNNSWSCSAFSYPTYRIYSGSSYTSYTLYLRPSASNCEVAQAMVPRRTETEILPYVSIGLLGVVCLCCIKRWSS